MDYKTKDMNFATVLVYFGATLLKVEKDPNKTTKASWFIFTGNTDFAGLEADYWKQELLVEPKRFYYAQRDVKNRLYNQ